MSRPAVSVRLTLLPGEYAVCRLAPGADAGPLPAVATAGLYSLTRTRSETSVVCPVELAPAAATEVERGWRTLEVAGPMAFTLTGVLAGITTPLAEEGIPVFAVSTYDTDHLLVQRDTLAAAVAALRAAGHTVLDGEPPAGT